MSRRSERALGPFDTDVPAHSPAPFGLVETETGFILTDSLGDSIGALARSTGDHPEEEQLANAWLFFGAPDLLRTMKLLIQTARPSNWADDEESEIAWRCAEAAIKRAEGRE